MLGLESIHQTFEHQTFHCKQRNIDRIETIERLGPRKSDTICGHLCRGPARVHLDRILRERKS